jgi:(p)ppGpp synthase/HD superfamily hydrolase
MDTSDLVQTALYVAAQAHNGQLRPGTDLPYIVHISDVALEVAAALAVESHNDRILALCCALLHDVLEDTTIGEAVLTAQFGPTITAGVLALTKNSALPPTERMADSLRRIQAQPREVWLVKLADRISNLSTPPPAHWSAERIAAYRSESELILATLGSASPYLAARLQTKIDRYGVINGR